MYLNRAVVLFRQINELVKRARMAKVHALIVTHLRNQFGFFGKVRYGVWRLACAMY